MPDEITKVSLQPNQIESEAPCIDQHNTEVISDTQLNWKYINTPTVPTVSVNLSFIVYVTCRFYAKDGERDGSTP